MVLPSISILQVHVFPKLKEEIWTDFQVEFWRLSKLFSAS